MGDKASFFSVKKRNCIDLLALIDKMCYNIKKQLLKIKEKKDGKTKIEYDKPYEFGLGQKTTVFG